MVAYGWVVLKCVPAPWSIVYSVYLEVLENLLKMEEICPSSIHVNTIQNMFIYFNSECLDTSVGVQNGSF